MDLRAQLGFLGTGASLLADLTLLAYIFLIVPAMLVGFYFARRKRFEPHHKWTMTTITLVNWALIAFLMATSYAQAVAPEVPAGLDRPPILLPTLHLFTGAIAQLLATYLLARMWLERGLPGWMKIRRIKPYMRATLGLWLVTAGLGIAIYFTWYSAGTATAGAMEPALTPEASSPITTPEPDEIAFEEPTATLETTSPAQEPAATPEADAGPA